MREKMKDNKTVIITGGGTGIGKGIALKLAKNNYNVILASRNVSNLEKVKNECLKYISSDQILILKTEHVFKCMHAQALRCAQHAASGLPKECVRAHA